jgi:hypothetical protein
MSFDLKIEKGDIAIDRDGTIKTVFDNEKLRQDIIKILLTNLRENKFHPEYGGDLGVLQIGHVADADFLELDLSSSAETAVNKIIALQRSQSKRQFLTPGETIIQINDISVSRDTIDPRMYNIFISVLTQKLTTVIESVSIRII